MRVLEWDCEALRALMAAEPSLAVGVRHILTATVYERLLPELREAATAEFGSRPVAAQLAATPTGGLYEAKGGGAVRAASAVPEALTAEERAEFARTLKRIETANAAEAPLARCAAPRRRRSRAAKTPD